MMNYVPLREIVDDFIMTLDTDDYVSGASDLAIRNFALRGIREIGFDVVPKIKSLKLSVTAQDEVVIPDDFVDMIKLGVVHSDGNVYVFGENKNINMSRSINNPATQQVFNSGPLDIAENEIDDRSDDKGPTSGFGTSNSGSNNNFDSYIFRNYIYENQVGRLYGMGGGHLHGEYRVNLDRNRIELSTNNDFTEVVMEYIADEARSSDPMVHVYAEETLRSYIYYKLCERKSTVPANEKARARAEFYNERRKAKARISNFTKEEAMKVIRKNYKQSPKY
ncbi:MAG: putative structural protein [Prokaryotic dsDNA virus sp.]|nr:MAG: putative structural protein [Prokaryotic dsDNA virus sp.]|tara:strand:- start:1425 stop:2261 length:837 start_codon:yes stop_codon:yes gene_type:complete